MGLSRRALLAAAAAAVGAVSGCAGGGARPGAPGSAGRAPAPTTSPSSTTTSTTPSATSTTPATTSPSATSPAPGPRSLADTVAAFAGHTPTYWGLSAPGVLTRFATGTAAGTDAVALTFDACGGAATRYDADLIALLRRYHVPATLFVNQTWAQHNPAIYRELHADPLFEIENHGHTHQPLSVTGRSAYGIKGTGSVAQVWHEVVDDYEYQRATFDHRTRFMRPGTAYADDVAVQIARFNGHAIAGFSVNADAGATYPPQTVAAQLAGVRPGDIVISHMNQPGHGTYPGYARALPALLDRGVRFRTLAEVC